MIKAIDSIDFTGPINVPKEFYPCSLEVLTCTRQDTGEELKICELITSEGKRHYLYPKGNEFAHKIAIVIQREGR